MLKKKKKKSFFPSLFLNVLSPVACRLFWHRTRVIFLWLCKSNINILWKFPQENKESRKEILTAFNTASSSQVSPISSPTAHCIVLMWETTVLQRSLNWVLLQSTTKQGFLCVFKRFSLLSWPIFSSILWDSDSQQSILITYFELHSGLPNNIVYITRNTSTKDLFQGSYQWHKTAWLWWDSPKVYFLLLSVSPT